MLLGDQVLDHHLLLPRHKHDQLIESVISALLNLWLLRLLIKSLFEGHLSRDLLLSLLLLDLLDKHRLADLILLLDLLLLLLLLLEQQLLPLVISDLTLLLDKLSERLGLVKLLKHKLGDLELHEHGLRLAALLILETILLLELIVGDNLAVAVEDEGAHLIILSVAEHGDSAVRAICANFEQLLIGFLSEDEAESL